MTPARDDAALAALRAMFVIGAVALLGALAVAPEGDGRDLERVLDWLRLNGDPSLVAVFNLLGVWPMVYAAVLLSDRRAVVPAWPFVASSFVAGGFVLLPYLVVRRWSAVRSERPGAVVRWVTGRGVGVVLLLAASGLVSWGLIAGDPSVYADTWRRSRLVFVMTADFVVVTLAWWPVLLDDARRRGGPSWAAMLGTLPVVGAPLWLVLRRP